MAPPVPRAVNRKRISLLMESTRETPEMAAEPTLDTIMVSTVPTSEVSTCSMISGINSRRSIRLENTPIPPSLEIYESVKFSLSRFQLEFKAISLHSSLSALHSKFLTLSPFP